MDCRGPEKRIEIAHNYHITPLAHLQLLNGQEKHSDAGAIIENDYYIFKLVEKSNSLKKESIICGSEAASDFLDLIHHKGLPVFNPLISATYNQSKQNKTSSFVSNAESKKVDKTAFQLLNAINWIILILNPKSETTIFEIKNTVETFKDREPYLSRIKAVNTIIKKCFKGELLSSKIDKLRKENQFREKICDFSLLNEKLGKEGIQSFF